VRGFRVYPLFILAVFNKGIQRRRSITCLPDYALVAGYAFILVAFTIERVSYIVGLRQTSIVFAVLMGSHFLKEKHPRIRLTGAMIILAGGFLISVAE
jgi:uncharacterized membrane protein